LPNFTLLIYFVSTGYESSGEGNRRGWLVTAPFTLASAQWQKKVVKMIYDVKQKYKPKFRAKKIIEIIT
jgi:hypothetical protein